MDRATGPGLEGEVAHKVFRCDAWAEFGMEVLQFEPGEDSRMIVDLDYAASNRKPCPDQRPNGLAASTRRYFDGTSLSHIALSNCSKMS